MSRSQHLDEDQRKHLDFIQAAITRMSGLSSTAKGWGITVSMAAFGISAAGSVPLFAVIGLASMGFFSYLDCRYLREERLFRYLYDDARLGSVEVYSMDRSAYMDCCTWRSVIGSWSVIGFYSPCVLVGAGSLAWSFI